MSKVLVVFGATGQQGGSVIDFVLNDPELSSQYNIRAVTRDPSKAAAQVLKSKGIEVFKGDFDDNESLLGAMQGAHTIFAMIVTSYDDQTKQRELIEGKAIANAAVAVGAEYLIFSTMPHVERLSGGKYHQSSFDGKAEVEDYIRTLPIKSAFFSPSGFMQNYVGQLAPQPMGDGTYAIASVASPQTQVPLMDVVVDTGKYVGAILAEPEKYEGKVFSAATKLYTMDAIARLLGEATGKTVKYNQLPESVFRGFLPPHVGDSLVNMFQWIQDFGYYGPQTKELVEWAAQNARGEPTTFEEYLAKNAPQLE